MAVDHLLQDENNHGSGGSTSSTNELARVSASTEAQMEPLIRLYEETIRPILADFKAEQEKFLSRMKEELGLDWSTTMTGNSSNMASTSGSQTLQLQFLNGISTPISTGMKIEGKDHKPIVVALVDRISGEIVSTGDVAAAKVEILVLKGDCEDGEAENWTPDDFNNKIIGEWKGKKILQGNTCLNLKEGIGSVDKISFTHNSVWKENRKCRLGARLENSPFATRVKEAKTGSFLVRDKRSRLYLKHQTPSLSDPLWRLKMISRRGARHDRLTEANIKTVMDFRTLHAINRKRLQDILGVGLKTLEDITNHAQMCKDDKGVYLYYYPRDGQKSNGVVFNLYGQLVGLIAESHFVPSDNLPNEKKADAQELIVSSSEHWEEVVPFNDEASLINHLQSGTIFNLSESPHNGLNLVTPQTIDTHDRTSHTSPQVITPIFPIGCTNNENNWEYANVGVTSQSQSPKRSATEHVMSNSQKKPRDDHPQMSPSVPSVGASRRTNMNVTIPFNQSWNSLCQEPDNLNPDENLLSPAVSENDDVQQYINLSQYDQLEAIAAQRWKTVLSVVEWILIISKRRKSHQLFEPPMMMQY